MPEIDTLGFVIKPTYEGEPDTNDFNDAAKTKLAGIAAGAQVNTVTSVNTQTGAVVITKADLGLGNVDNTSDVNKPISTATQAALTAITSNGSNLPVTGTGTTGITGLPAVASILADRATTKGTYFNAVTDFGIDNSGNTDVRDKMQAFLALAGKSYHVTLEIPAGQYLIGSNLTPNVQDILHYHSNCTIIIRGDLLHNLNSGNQHIIAGENVSTDGGSRNDHVFMWWLGGRCVFMPRTISQTRKGPNFSFTDTWCSVGYQSAGDDSGNFTFQFRDANDGVIMASLQKAGDSVGEDGVHGTRSCNRVAILGLNIESGDDALSLTQENGGGPYFMQNITVGGCNLSSTQNSAAKVLVDAQSAALGSYIAGVDFHGGSWTCARKQPIIGTLGRFTTDPAYPLAVRDINVVGVNGDNEGGFISSTSVRVDYATRVSFKGFKMRNTLRNGFIFNGSMDCSLIGCELGLPTSQASVSDVTLVVGSIVWTSGTTFVVTCTNDPDLSTVGTGPTFTGLTIPPGASAPLNASNVGTWLVTATNNTAKTITCSISARRQSATDNETGLSAPAYIRKQAGELISVAGAQNLTLDGNTLYGSQVGADGRLQCHTSAIILKTDTSSSSLAFDSQTVGLGFKTFTTYDLISTSTTSIPLATGTAVFTTSTGRSYPVNSVLTIVSAGTPANTLVGTVTSYVSGTGVLTVNVSAFTGTGTSADWNINKVVSGFALQTGSLMNIVSAGTPANTMLAKVVSYTGSTLNVQVVAFTGGGTNTDWNLSISPRNVKIKNNHFVNFPMEVGVNIQQGNSIIIDTNDATGCKGRFFIQEGTNNLNGNNRLIDNLDEGVDQYAITAQVSKLSSLSKGTRGNNFDRIRFDVSIPIGQTTATVVFANSYVAPTGTNVTNVSGGWTRAFSSANMTTRHMRLVPTSLEFQDFFVTLSGSTYTITLKTAPVSAAATASGELATDVEW